ncbi:MAG: hypothetical protein Q9164_002900, partial [Protoblastenia rupestris]
MSRRSHVGGSTYLDDEREYYSSRRDPTPRRSAPVAEYDEIDIRERRRGPAPEPEFLREDYGRRSTAGELVIRERSRSRERLPPPSAARSTRGGDVELRGEVVIREKSRERPKRREVVEDEVVISKGRKTKERDRGYDE